MINYLSKPFKWFFKLEAASGLVLLIAAILALFISKVTKKKKIAIRASFIQCNTDSFNPKLFIPINRYLFKVEKYNSAKLELLIINAIIAANNKTNPLAASSLKNHLKGFDK